MFFAFYILLINIISMYQSGIEDMAILPEFWPCAAASFLRNKDTSITPV